VCIFRRRNTATTVDSDEAKRIAEAQAEFANFPLAEVADNANMPNTLGSWDLTANGGPKLKPLSQQGVPISRAIDDINSAIDFVNLRDSRRKSD
jgi:hypothetical protein